LIYQGKREERFEALGEMLGIVLDVVPPTKSASIIANEPDLEYGLPTVFPVYSGNPYYHNLSIWPFIQGFWAWGANVVENEDALLKALAVQTRLAALELTFKELSRMETGDGTNADYQLWSAAGYLCTIYRGLFGIRLQENGISFHPLIPKRLAGKYTLEGIKYRDAILNITLEGQGNMVSAFYIDGKKQEKPFFPATLSGKHEIKIIVSPLPLTYPESVLPNSKFNVTLDISKLRIEKPILEYRTSNTRRAKLVKPSLKQEDKCVFSLDSPRLTSAQHQLFIRLANLNKPYNVIKIIPPVQIEAPKKIVFTGLEEARKGRELKVTLINNKDTAVKTSLRYFLPRGWRFSPKPEPLSLSAKEKRELTFTVSSQTALYGTYKISLRASAYPLLTYTVDLAVEDFMDLAGKWLFKVGDNPVYAKPEYDDTDWMLIKVPARWEDEGIDFFELSTVRPYEGPYNGYAWYRLHVVVPEEWEGYNLLLVMGAIDDCDVTYWNGYLVGQTGSEKYTAWCATRRYIIPRKVIRYGAENIIAVRVYDGGGAGGIWQPPVMLKVAVGK